MFRLLFRRVLISIPILLAVTLVVFLLLQVAPGDPARRAAGGESASQAQVDDARERLGLNDPMVEQFGTYLGGILTGDLGRSFFSNQPVVDAIADRLPVSISLMTGSLVVALLIALPAGAIAAVRPGGWIDRLVMLMSSAGVAMPSFFIGLLLAYLFAVQLDWLPATGFVPLEDDVGAWARSLALPWLTLGLAAAAEISRFLRASLRDVLDQDYVRTARAKGLPTSKVIGKHAMKNASIPVVTVIGLQVRFLLGGTIVVEEVFGLNGLGSLAVKSVLDRDYPLIQGIAISTAVIVVAVNLLVDLSYGYFNPKVRAE